MRAFLIRRLGATPAGARLGLLAILAATCALSYTHNYYLGANDDRLWLYHTGAQIGRGADRQDLEARVSASLRQTGANANKQWRYQEREQYRTNYVAATAIYRLAADTVRRTSGDLSVRDYPAYLARAMYAGSIATYVTVVIILLAIVSPLPPRQLAALVVAVALVALLEIVFDLFGDTWWGLPVLLPDAQTNETFWQVFGPNFPGMLLNPQVQMSPFGDTPRNHFILLALAVFTLRWRGAYTAGYACLLGMSFLHQSQTGLLTAYLLGTDAVLRPQLYRSPAAVVMAAIVVMYVSRETLGDAMGVARLPVILTVLGLVAMVTALVWAGLRQAAARSAVMARLAAFRSGLLARGPVLSDLVVIGTIWVATFPVAAAINARGTELQSLYFWTQVHGRSLGILRPAAVFGLVLLATTRGPADRVMASARWALVAAGLTLLPSAYLASRHSRTPIENLERQLRTLDAQTGPVVDWNGIGAEGEERIYYALARELDRRRHWP